MWHLHHLEITDWNTSFRSTILEEETLVMASRFYPTSPPTGSDVCGVWEPPAHSRSHEAHREGLARSFHCLRKWEVMQNTNTCKTNSTKAVNRFPQSSLLFTSNSRCFQSISVTQGYLQIYRKPKHARKAFAVENLVSFLTQGKPLLSLSLSPSCRKSGPMPTADAASQSLARTCSYPDFL